MQHAVDDLVDNAVPAEGDDHIDSLVTCHAAEFESMPAIARELDREIELGLQRVDEDVGDARGGGGRPRINNQKAAHMRSLARRAGATRP